MKKPKALNKPRCGMCEVDNIENWEEHEKTEEHQRNLRAFLGIVASGEYRKERLRKFGESIFTMMNLENLKGKEVKSVEVRTDLGESEVLYITFKDGKVLKVYANGCPEFGYALHLSLINQNQKVGI